MSPRTKEATPTTEASHWSGKGTTVDELTDELLRLHHEHMSHDHGHSAARTLNLTVAPCGGDIEKSVEWAVARLGGHNASRTIILREHEADRLDARAVIKCERPSEGTDGLGLCHDVVTLTANPERLAHCASMVAPLIVTGLPSVLWMPDATRPLPDPALLERVEQVVLDTHGAGLDALRNAAWLSERIAVRDLSWGRLDFWRAATAAVFDHEDNLRLLPKVDSLELTYADGGLEPAYLYSGWVAARAGWKPGPIAESDGELRGEAKRGRKRIEVALRHDTSAPGCGGVESATLSVGSDRIEVSRGAARDDDADPFPVALRPVASFSRGYDPAVQATLAMLG